jgi:hypothetical protein
MKVSTYLNLWKLLSVMSILRVEFHLVFIQLTKHYYKKMAFGQQSSQGLPF